MYNDYTCCLYIEKDWTLEKTINIVKGLTNGSRSNKTITNDILDIDIEESQDADKNYIKKKDGFLFYKFNAYTVPKSENKEKKYIISLSKLISDLRHNGAKVVASCEFEEDIAHLTGWNWSEKTPHHP